MNLKKHAGAKLSALAATLFALAGTLVLVHRNPPPSTAAASQQPPASSSTAQQAPSDSGSSTTSSTQNNSGSSQGSSYSAPSTMRTHTRTHVS